MLSQNEIDRYQADGFLKVEGFATAEACDALIARARELVSGFEPPEAMSVFSTTDQARTTDDYFMESGDKIRFFLEEGALSEEGRLRLPKELSINKIGHALHDLDPVFDRFSRAEGLASIAAALGVKSPLLLQSMYIFKQPGVGGEVVCHQDSTFLYTDPPSVVGFWFALEDATIENGCLWAIPGEHKGGPRSRFVRDPQGGVKTIPLDPRPFPMDRLVPIEAPKGTLVVLHGACPHMSYANTSPRSRHAYAVHVIDGEAKYHEENWLRRAPEMPPRGFA